MDQIEKRVGVDDANEDGDQEAADDGHGDDDLSGHALALSGQSRTCGQNGAYSTGRPHRMLGQSGFA